MHKPSRQTTLFYLSAIAQLDDTTRLAALDKMLSETRDVLLEGSQRPDTIGHVGQMAERVAIEFCGTDEAKSEHAAKPETEESPIAITAANVQSYVDEIAGCLEDYERLNRDAHCAKRHADKLAERVYEGTFVVTGGGHVLMIDEGAARLLSLDTANDWEERHRL